MSYFVIRLINILNMIISVFGKMMVAVLWRETTVNYSKSVSLFFDIKYAARIMVEYRIM